MQLTHETLATLLVRKHIGFMALAGDSLNEAVNITRIVGFDREENAYMDAHYDRYVSVIPIDGQGQPLVVDSRFNADDIEKMIEELPLPNGSKTIKGSKLTQALIEMGASVLCTLSESADDETSLQTHLP